jgi:protein SCO1/2
MPNPTQPPGPSPYLWLIRLLAVIIILLFLYRFFSGGQISPSTELRRINVVPPFSLTERSGKTITNRDLMGKIWVADFVFTTCPGPCPLITAGMAKIQDAVASDPHVQLVSFTVDPENDTPAVLTAYANKFGADPNRWWFLTGPEKPLYELILHGFYQSVQDNHGKQLEPGEFVVTHSTSLVLVDAQGVVRATYDGVSNDGRTNLLQGIRTLEKEEKQ